MMELLKDPDFSAGLLLSKQRSSEPDPFGAGALSFFEEKEPICKLTQWFSGENIGDVAPVREAHRVAWNGRCKTVEYTAFPGKSPKLRLVCDCFEEYGGAKPSPDFYGWVHMGIHQPLAEESYRLKDLRNLNMQMRLKLSVEDKAAGVPVKDYTGQFNLCFIIKNLNSKSPDYNKFIWNQVSLFDCRYDIPPEYCGVDAGVDECSGEFIYTMDAHEMLKEPIGNGEEVVLRYDWLPEMKTALNKVQSKGGMKHTEFNDLSVMDFSYGFEVFRGIVINLELSDIHVTAETK